MNYLERLEAFYDKNVDKIKLFIYEDDPITRYEYVIYLKGPTLPLSGPLLWYTPIELTPEENKVAFLKSAQENITFDLRWIKS